jgi:GNAT superfamily N-acetyltransferase
MTGHIRISAIDKTGAAFEVRSFRPEEKPFLEEMYDMFAPKASFQGLPPEDREVRLRWISGLIRDGETFLAWKGKKVVGHVVILPDLVRLDAEYLIFVDQSHRGRGVGKELTLAAIRKARAIGLNTVWLTVDSYNFTAIKLYKKVGFKLHEEHSSTTERVMVLRFQETGT